MHAHTTGQARAQRPAATFARWAAVIATAAALAACGTPRVAAATPGGSASNPRTLTYYAFDINNGTTDPGFIPAPGTNPKVFAQGDELIINDQLTTTRQVNGGYPIVGHDAGVCTLTRIPEQHADQTPGELCRHRRLEQRQPDRPGSRRLQVPAARTSRTRGHRRNRPLRRRGGHARRLVHKELQDPDHQAQVSAAAASAARIAF